MKGFQLILLLLFSLIVRAQKDSAFHFVKYFAGEIADAAIDNLDNVYLLSSTDQLKKYDAAGDSIAVYNNIRKFGKLYSIDVSNPLKVLLYYKDFSNIVVLDRLLAQRSMIDLKRSNLLQVSAIGLSYDNNIWAFDEYDNKLKKINEEGRVLLETPDLRTVFQQSISPQQIIDQNKQVYVYDSTNGVFVFDQFGTFKRKIPIKGWSQINITDKYISGVTTKGLHSYSIASLLEAEEIFPGNFSPYYRYNLTHNKLLALSKEGLYIYRY